MSREPFPWPDLFPELQSIIRCLLNPRAAALLALTCRAELTANPVAARNYLQTLAAMPFEELNELVPFLSERLAGLDAHELGKLHHAIATSRPIMARTTLAISIPPGKTVDICEICRPGGAGIATNQKLFYSQCHSARGRDACHEKRILQCSAPGCPDLPVCHTHARFACMASEVACPNSFHRCESHASSVGHMIPDKWHLCKRCRCIPGLKALICPDCYQRTRLCFRCARK